MEFQNVFLVKKFFTKPTVCLRSISISKLLYKMGTTSWTYGIHNKKHVQ